MKKLFNFLIIGAFLASCGSEPQGQLADDNCPFVTAWYNNTDYTLTITGGAPISGQALNPPIGTVIAANGNYKYCLFEYVTVDIKSSDGTYKGTASVSVEGSGDGRYLFDKNGFMTFTYDAGKSHYESDCWKDIRAEDITIAVAPKFVDNAGWENGLGNSESSLVANNDYWGVDYGDDKWSIHDDAAWISTKTGQYNDVGSRAFPFLLTSASPDYNVGNGVGAAKDGVWQIDVKIGSNGTGDFCETFYLAERLNMNPGVPNYKDGAGGGKGGGGYGREIDILETKWNGCGACANPEKVGPQMNLPNGKNSEGVATGWVNETSFKYFNYVPDTWANNGGAPAKEFSTFGAFIDGNNLWIYAYKTDGTQWYCTDAIPLDNDSYDQTGDFVPYICTWGTAGSADVFETGYKNYVYLPANDIHVQGKNPKDNPEAFGPVLNK